MSNQDLEDNLFQSIRDGDERAYIRLYDCFKHELIQYALQKLGDPAEAEDVIQDFFLSIWSNRSQLPAINNIRGYMYLAIRNRILNALRKRKNQTHYLASLGSFMLQQESIYGKIYEKELQESLDKELDKLPNRMQEVFKLSREEHLSHKEISQQLGTSEQTVSKQITNTLRILRSKFKALIWGISLLISLLN
ncbi:RNA polymerase sigma factor [Sphingobacterium sp. Mn56C]|uniref:RNA polymerase sigma factor n=1 Tax=Sphingobacterium sp. Mn56C TaxID=3395261 RepID=UPI003BDDE34D